MPSLYDLTEQFAALEAALVEASGEVTPDVEAAFAALGDLEADRVDAYAVVVRGLESHRDACKAEAAALKAKADVADNSARRLKERMQAYLESRGVKEIKGTIWRAAIQQHGGLRPLTLHVPPALLPAEFQRVTVAADMDKIRALLCSDAELARLGKLGVDPEHGIDLSFRGALVAHLGPRGSSVRFR